MKKIILHLVIFLGMATTAHAQQQIPLPEHPRPDFERPEWQNLNGEWSFTFNRAAAEQGIGSGQLSGFDLKIQVPFPWGSKLSGVDNSGDVGFYGRSITVPDAWKGRRIFLTVGACDWDTKVWLDGVLLGSHQGGYTPFAFELTDHVRFGMSQTLIIGADDTPADNRLYGKQGYGDARGIWQTVYLEARGENFMDYVHFSPDIDRSAVKVETALDRLPEKNMQIRVRFKNGNQPDFVFPLRGKALKTKTQQFEIKLTNQHLWDTDDPWLYETEISLLAGDRTVDCVNAYFGQRKISVAKLPGRDEPYVALNNKPVYLQLTLDQSYHPEGFYTFPSDHFMRDEILLSKRLGLTGNRIHIKAEIPRKLYWADKLGLLIMADVPNWWGEPCEAAQKDWEYCMRQQVKRDFNHPSIFAWVDFNETWGLFTKVNGKNTYLPETQEWVRRMYLENKKLDPTRLVEDNSACNRDHVQTDLNTWHSYPPGYLWKELIDNEVKNTYAGSAWNFIGENRQDGAPMLNSECGNVWGYEGSTGDVDIAWDYHIMMNEFRSHPLCAGWLYTEHHDVINEWNGYVRYDRTPKYDGMDAFVPGMTLADLHTLYYIAPQGDLCREARAGETLEIPLFASFMTGRNPGALRLETSLAGWDALGNESLSAVATYPVAFKPYMNESIAPAKVTLPAQKGLYALRYELKTAEGSVLGRNFSLIRVKEGENPVTDRKTQLVTIPPAQFSGAQWSGKQWNVLDGLKVNGAGSGYFEYTIPWPQGLSIGAAESVTLIFEASAKKLHGKDVEGASSDNDGDYMLGKGMMDPSKNRNAYPMTDLQTFPSYVKIYVNGKVCGDAWLPDDPADHRGALSWLSQPHDRRLYEAGSCGYLIKTPVPLTALIEGQDIRIRLETPDGINGGLAIYGKDFGRYPLDPTLVFVGKQPPEAH
ncbi:MAG: glycoside hydrolase family 2 [Tannerella sp.]|jgi:hypothetical protein|nr:glycoside hydrolase family 2 [Tannerella sp.]